MTPDNKDTSDTAGKEPANDEIIEHSDDVADAKASQSAQARDKDAQSVIDPEGQSESDQSASDEQEDEDPLGFGDERMSDEAEDDTEADEEEEDEDELTVLQKQLIEAESKSADYWDRLLRLQADMENQRKRAQNDVTKARKFALEGIVGDLLPVKDSLELGLAAAAAEDADPKSLVEGAELTLKMLAQVLEKNNVLEVNPVDEKFDPEFHQAMSMQEVEGKPANIVTGVMQKGYTLNERLVRPALVMVSK